MAKAVVTSILLSGEVELKIMIIYEPKHMNDDLADDLLQRQQQKENLIKSRERTLNLIKSSLDILVAAGLLKLAPRTVTPRITGALGFITSAISCYQLLPTPPKAKSS